MWQKANIVQTNKYRKKKIWFVDHKLVVGFGKYEDLKSVLIFSSELLYFSFEIIS